MGQIVLHPVIAFLIFLIMGYLLYKWGGVLGPKPTRERGKLSTYACGEDIPRGKVRHSYHLFHFAFFFTVLHVAALVIATVPSGSMALLGIIYLAIAIIAVIILLVD